MSLDWASQGVPVLWGSFEVRNPRLAQTMLQQIVRSPLFQDSDEKSFDEGLWQEASRRLGQLPLQFMDLHGSCNLETVLEAMEATIQSIVASAKEERGGGEEKPLLIILDNLQFMLSGQGNSALDRWEVMDRAISAVRSFCSYWPVHLMLVVHPRKEADDTLLGISSVAGTAKATQEADNVIILQKIQDDRYLEVKKNRFHGELGRVPIGFLPEERLIAEIRKEKRPIHKEEDREEQETSLTD